MSEQLREAVVEWIALFRDLRSKETDNNKAVAAYKNALDAVDKAFDKVDKASGRMTPSFIQVDGDIVELTRKTINNISNLEKIELIVPEVLEGGKS